MAWSFGDSFDLYAAPADMITGYWDSGASPASSSFVTGRFSGSRALNIASSSNFVKSSGVNDAVHHIVVSFQQNAAITGSTLGAYFTLMDAATTQCSVVFRTDGAILLASGAANGTVLATYAGAFSVASTWYAFEFEIVIHPTAGSFTVRKNGNTVADFTATSLNTRPTSANAYANKLVIGSQGALTHYDDDLFWQSSAATGVWLGDIRCYARMPASDASVTFSRAPTSVTQTPFTVASTLTPATNTSYYLPFTAAYDGTVSTVSASINAGYTGNLKCSVFNGTSSTITTLVASATTLTNPVTGANTITFPSPFAVSKGSVYWIGVASDTAAASAFNVGGGANCRTAPVGYSAFPTANPGSLTSANAVISSANLTIGSNATLVNDAQQDALTSYVYDSTPGDADFYGVASIASTPATVIATTVRAYAQKSDAGTRTMAVQLKSGATTVASPTLVLTTSGFQWAWRTDTTDPNTGAAWTPAAVNNCTIGPRVVA
jgi:hypothetical protein